MGVKVGQLFVNLPVKDLNASKEFFGQLGFEFDERFSDEKGACLILGSNMYAMLLAEDFFSSFTHKGITDTHKENECILAINVSSKEEVDEMFNKALEAGGEDKSNPEEDEMMYFKRISDLDGHLWEICFMDFNQFDNTEYTNNG
ncbi:glyoxalase/bleomycin resistance/extradiol dioxygenase family protein [Desemzia sp. RIT804]|uniref:VOC family protein n=1 Tax=Desemzia sp. RIT 804 TaxID=2810209 RepID=UPI00195227F4|nr:VOC family protein [Desemzia sp. RIT 804]MBM6614335.1 glyoxalase/bleomycin resistance/extradiol dioxygenase family protein [Desemzia sp. RIT 804]